MTLGTSTRDPVVSIDVGMVGVVLDLTTLRRRNEVAPREDRALHLVPSPEPQPAPVPARVAALQGTVEATRAAVADADLCIDIGRIDMQGRVSVAGLAKQLPWDGCELWVRRHRDSLIVGTIGTADARTATMDARGRPRLAPTMWERVGVRQGDRVVAMAERGQLSLHPISALKRLLPGVH